MLKLKIIVKKSYAIRPMDLLKAREQAGLSQQELAEKLDLLGWTQQNISNIEGQLLLHHIDFDVVKRFAEAGFEIEYEEID